MAESRGKKKIKINDKPKVETNKSFTTEQDPEQEYTVGRSTTMEERTREQTLNEIQDCEIDTQMT